MVVGAPWDLDRLDGDGASLGHFQVKAHHGFIDAADLFDVERAVAEAFSVEDEQVTEYAENHAVGDAGHVELVLRLVQRSSTLCLQETS